VTIGCVVGNTVAQRSVVAAHARSGKHAAAAPDTAAARTLRRDHVPGLLMTFPRMAASERSTLPLIAD